MILSVLLDPVSLEIAVIATAGEVVSTTKLPVAWVAAVPALSETSAVKASVPVSEPTSEELSPTLHSPPLASAVNVLSFTPKVTV